MKNKILFASGFILSQVFILSAIAQGTAFSYSGRLNDNGNPASGSYDLRFTLHDAVTNGTMFGALTNTATGVSNGLFAVTLDFGSVFNGSNYWLELAARTNGGGAFIALNPRQPILPVPYAIYAASAGSAGSVAAENISGALTLPQLPGVVLTNNQNDTSLSGFFNGFHSGDGNSLTNLNPLALASGNVGGSLYFTNEFNFFRGGFNGYHSGDGNYLTNLNPLALAPGNVGSSLYFTNEFNFFRGGFSGYHSGDGNYLTNLNPLALAPGNVGSSLYFTNEFNFFRGGFSGYHSGDGNYLTNLNPLALAPGNVGSSLYFTNEFNFFRGGFNGYHSGDGNYLTNLNPLALAPGNVGSSLYFTNEFNFFRGGFNGYHSGDGNYLTNLNPLALAPGNVGAALYFTNEFNFFRGGFSGFHSGDGNYLTNLNPAKLSAGTAGIDISGNAATATTAANASQLASQLASPGVINSSGNPVSWSKLKDVPASFASGSFPSPGGDLSGSIGFAAVVGLQGRPISASTPVAGQVLTYNGSQWQPAAPPGLTTNIAMLVPGGGTNILCFTNGILRAIQ